MSKRNIAKAWLVLVVGSVLGFCVYAATLGEWGPAGVVVIISACVITGWALSEILD